MGQPSCKALAARPPEAGPGAGGQGGRDSDSDGDSGDFGRLTARRQRPYFSADGTDTVCLSGALRECQQRLIARRQRQHFSADGTDTICLSGARRECQYYRARAARRSRAPPDLAADADSGWRDTSEADEDEDWAWGDLEFTTGSHGLGEDDVNALPSRALTPSADMTDLSLCAVCQDGFEVQERIMELACSHVFHQSCLKRWLVVTAKCPTCKCTVEPPQRQD
jgi:hypothetical protein